MSGVLNGNYVWVLDTDDCGGVDRVIRVAQDTGYGICAKFHDGDPADDAKYGFQEKFAKLAARCAPLKIPLIAWGYCYGDTYGNLAKEAAAAVQSLDSGTQAYVIDAESEWEVKGSDRWAARFMQAVFGRAPGAEIAMTTFWNLRWHARFPANAFWLNGCSVAMPQVYYHAAQRSTTAARKEMHSIATADFSGAGFGRLYPVGEFSGDIGDTLDFLDTAGGGPHSFWLVDGFQDSPSMKLLALCGQAVRAKESTEVSQAKIAALEQNLSDIRKALKYLSGLAQ